MMIRKYITPLLSVTLIGGCASLAQPAGTRVVVGHIVSTQSMSIWSGSILSEDELVYEFKEEGGGEDIIALIPTIYGHCPLDKINAATLLQIEYDMHGADVVYPDVNTPKRLITRNNIVSCSILEK
tara:strand:+ start:637 stop:1014 length:378 start_codon:yes stop_codon:yes gene_type:complete